MKHPEEPAAANAAAQLTIPIGDLRWTQVLPMLIAALKDGTPTGVRMAQDHLSQMAVVADLAHTAIHVLQQARSGSPPDEDVLLMLSLAIPGTGERGH